MVSQQNRFWPWVFLFLLLLVGLTWISSGTLSGYAAATRDPRLVECGYLTNPDHIEFEAQYKFFLDPFGPNWRYSQVMRRILYPAMAFPGMYLFGFFWGGFLLNLFVSAICFLFSALYFRKRHGDRAALGFLGLLCSFPAYHYYSGLPYGYAFIAPFCALTFIGFDWYFLKPTLRRLTLLSLSVGILLLAYDLMGAVFLAGMYWLFWLKRKEVSLVSWVLGPVLALLPIIVWTWVLQEVFDHPWRNAATGSYLGFIKVIFGLSEVPLDWKQWGAQLAQAPRWFFDTVMYSHYVVLPLACIGIVIFQRLLFPKKGKHVLFEPAEQAMLFGGLAYWGLAHLSPPYGDFDVRGSHYPRYFEFYFMGWIGMLARAGAVQALLWRACQGVIALQVILLLSQLVAHPVISKLHWRHFKHGDPHTYRDHIQRFGARPIGVCRKGLPEGRLSELPPEALP